MSLQTDNVVMEKAEDFAIRICKLNNYLVDTKHEKVISNQILRSGTSIGANIAEAEFAESTIDFVHKLKISRKEANETKYWLRILYRTEKITESEFKSMLFDCDLIIKLLTKIILSCRNRQQSENNEG